MLKSLNAEYYPLRPEQMQERPVDTGIWFWPGSDSHALMKAISAPSGRVVREAQTRSAEMVCWLGQHADTEKDVETLIRARVLAASPGQWEVTLEAVTVEADERKPFMTFFDGSVATLEEFDEVLENATPAILALTC